MALPPLADPAELGAWLGQNLDDDQRAVALIAAASARVRLEVGRTWVDADGNLADVPDVVPGLVVEIAAAAFRNPEGLTSETIGNYSYARGDDAGALGLSPSQRALIGRLRSRAPIWTLSTTRGCEEERTFLIDQYGGDPILDGP